MRRVPWRSLLAAASVLGCVAAVAVWLMFPPQPRQLSDIINAMEFAEVNPPSDFYAPGTLNTIEVLSTGKLALHPTCEVSAEALRPGTRESPTVEWQQNLSASFDMSDRVRGLLSTSFTNKGGLNVSVSFRDVVLLTMSDEALSKVRGEVIKQACEEAIVENLKGGGIVCQTSEAIKATMVYRISFRNDMTAAEQGAISKEVSAKLGLQAGVQAEDGLLGRGLFFGVRLQPTPVILNVDGVSPGECRRRGK